eukprot:TRINITY_DN498_c3_g1_i1.p4 TRINITY_DN498_c3_g1~~TRINITY_DN498_c3_g1_i1.p4  ORF type:complete len:149 (+),score=67.36 TRINITY_DN498_c3_g1_i1:55-501(+)
MDADDFHAMFDDEPAANRRSAAGPLSGGNVEKNRANRADLNTLQRADQSGRKGRVHGEFSIDDFLADPMCFNGQASSASGGARKERVLTDNVDEIEAKMWADAPKQGDYKLEDEWDQAYKEMLREGTKESNSCAISSEEKENDDEFDF